MILSEKARNMQIEGTDIEKIRLQLTLEGTGAATLETVILSLKKVIIENRRKRGIKLGVAAIILLITGFILTVIFYHSTVAIHCVTCIITSVGVILLLIAMIYLLGW